MAFCCVLIILGIFFGDLWIKNRIEEGGAPAGRASRSLPESLWGNRILIRKYHNKGAAMNLGQHQSRAVATLSVALCLVMTVVFLLSLGQKGNQLLRIGLAFLLGGAFSNTYDRLKRKYVVDYFSFHVKWDPLRRTIFNISDFCIILGALLCGFA